MQIKLDSADRFSLLKVGDVIQKFPSKGSPEFRFNESRIFDIISYEIKTINHKKQTLSLLAVCGGEGIFVWPADEQREYLNLVDLLSDRRWWITVGQTLLLNGTQIIKCI